VHSNLQCIISHKRSISGQPLSDTQTVATADWQEYIQKMATAIIQEQSPQQ
jgi:hypothetical protein